MSEERNTRATRHSFLDAIAAIQTPELRGRYIRLESLDGRHIEGLAAASAASPHLYQWSPVPQGKLDTSRYVETELCWREAGTAAPFAILRLSDGAVIGSTRFWKLESDDRDVVVTPDQANFKYACDRLHSNVIGLQSIL